MGDFILVIDEGTTSTRAMLFDGAGKCHATEQRDITQHYPAAGRVEHDAAEIWEKTLGVAQAVIAIAGGAGRIAAIGITNQRETVVAWDRGTGKPLARALVWQDRRTADFCGELKAAGKELEVQLATGLLLDPYFSGTKMRWLIDNEPAVAEAAANGRLALGTIEAWLIFKLTGGAMLSDATNASRTLLMALDGPGWDAGLCDMFGVPMAALPEICDSAGALATTDPALFGAAIPICGSAGDQQAATIGQGCLAPGATKATYGTGAFVLTQYGADIPRSTNRLLSTVAVQLGGERQYALEGSVFVAGSLVKWLRDDIGLFDRADQTETLARSVPDNGGVYLVPALSGLGAPHWRADARAALTGLDFSTSKAHVARAALEAMSYQSNDLKNAFAADGADWTNLRIDGGMVANDWMVQDLADILGIAVERPAFIESTALGAAMLAAVGCGMHASLADAAAAMLGPSDRFEPRLDAGVRADRLAGWRDALGKVLG